MANNRAIRIAEFASAVGLFLLGAGMSHILAYLHVSEAVKMPASIACVVTGLGLIVHSIWKISRPDTSLPPTSTPPQPVNYVNPYGPYIMLPTPSVQDKLAEIELKQREIDAEIRAFARALCQWVDATKKRERKSNLAFSEEVLRRDAMPGYGAHLPAVLDLLRREGRARPTGSPGWWFID